MKMKIVLAAVLLMGLATFNANAQSSKGGGLTDIKGTNFLNAGIGLGSYGLAGTGGLPITASFEHGFSKNISAGVTAGFVHRTFAGDWNYTYLIFGARGSYHFNEALNIANPKLDVYGGAGLLYRHYSVKTTYYWQGGEPGAGDVDSYNSSAGTVDFDLHAGTRYLFSEHVGGFAELGYGISPLQLGLSLKF